MARFARAMPGFATMESSYYNDKADQARASRPEPKRVTFWHYLLTREFWSIIGAVLLGGVVLVLATFYLVFPLITKHNETRETPDVTSHPARDKYVTMEQAFRLLEEQGFEPVVSDSVYYPHMKPRAVVRQEPVALTLVKPGRNVYLVVNKATAPDVKLPDVKDLQLAQAKNLLLNWKLKVGRIEYMPGDHPGIVMKARYKDEDLPRFASVPEGAAIDLVVSQGVGDLFVPYPNVKGMFFQEALEALKMAGLNPKITFTGREPVEEYEVLSQSPKARGDSIRYGSTVLLSVSGEEPEDGSFDSLPPVDPGPPEGGLDLEFRPGGGEDEGFPGEDSGEEPTQEDLFYNEPDDE